MDSKASTAQTPRPLPDRDFLKHLEAYLAKRDGVDKLLKISRYAAKIVLASSLLPEPHPLTPRLRSFDSSVGLSRKAFRLGKFVQDLNALRDPLRRFDSPQTLLLSLLAYGGEGLYYFVEQFVWLAKSGLIDPKHSKNLQLVSAWAELVGYAGSVWSKLRDLKAMAEEGACLRSRGLGCAEEEKRERKLREKMVLKKVSIVQDLADGLMALADVRGGDGLISAPMVVSCAGMLSALISTHKNWVSC